MRPQCGDSSSWEQEAPPCRAVSPELAPALSPPMLPLSTLRLKASPGTITVPTGCSHGSTSRRAWNAMPQLWGEGASEVRLPGMHSKKARGP